MKQWQYYQSPFRNGAPDEGTPEAMNRREALGEPELLLPLFLRPLHAWRMNQTRKAVAAAPNSKAPSAKLSSGQETKLGGALGSAPAHRSWNTALPGDYAGQAVIEILPEAEPDGALVLLLPCKSCCKEPKSDCAFERLPDCRSWPNCANSWLP